MSVIGLGYVGSVAATALAKSGHDVIGIDIDTDKINSHREGVVPFYEPGLPALLSSTLRSGNLRFLHTTEISEPLGDVILIATGTLTAEDGSVDLSNVQKAISWARQKQTRGILLMKSTVPPGTGVMIGKQIRLESDFEYVSNPEVLREGQAVHDWFNPDRIVIGSESSEAIKGIKSLYNGIDAPFLVTNTTSAELIKYASNAMLATRVSFMNEIASFCDQLGANIDDVRNGIALDPRIGSGFLSAGIGYGGSCLPKDLKALTHLSTTEGIESDLFKSVLKVNNKQRLLPLDALRKHFGGRLDGIKIGVLGLSFKPNTDDIREAPSIDLIRALVDDGAEVSAYDPQAIHVAKRVLPSSVRLEQSLLACAKKARALVLVTEWPEIIEADWGEIASVVDLPMILFDGRNVLDPQLMTELGFQYQGIGRGWPSSVKTRVVPC